MIKFFHKQRINIVTLIFLFSVILPYPPFLFGLYGEVATLVILAIILLALSVAGNAKIDISALYIMFALFTLLLISLTRDNARVPKDFLELSRPIMWFLTYSVFYSLCWIVEPNKVITKVFYFLNIIAVWGIVEVYLPDQLFFHKLYKLDAPVYWNKAISSFIAPYSFAAVMGVGFVISYIRFRTGALPFLRGFFSVILFLLAIFLSQSKSGILGVCIVLIIYEVRHPNYISFILMMAVFAVIYYMLVVLQLLPYVSSFVLIMWNAFEEGGLSALPGASPSVGNRVEQLGDVLAKSGLLPVFGQGIGKGYLYLESIYSLWLFRYGILGVAILALICAHCIVICRKLSRAQGTTNLENSLINAFPFIILYFFVVSISSNVIDQFRVALVYVSFVAILRASYLRHKIKHLNTL